MRRMFWLSVGAAAGYYAARRGEQALEQARARGVVGNVTLAATTASKVAASATKAAVAVGEAAGSRTRRAAESTTPIDPIASPTGAAHHDVTTREARP